MVMKDFTTDKSSSKSASLPHSEVPPPEGFREAVRIAFKMQLFQGFEEEYKKRHDEIWPELQTLLKQSGISHYSIFFDETTNSLFGVMKVEDPKLLDNLPAQPVMQKWWKYMGDIMESNPDNSPVQTPLKEVFYLP